MDITTAPPAPWIARDTISQVAFGAMPQATDASVNTATPMPKIVRRPSRSDTEPAGSSSAANASVYALIVHWVLFSDVPNSRPISGSAIATTLMSSVMRIAAMLVSATVQRRIVGLACVVS
nr:hypothetical protein [Herbihabitans rhizosphaerae]